VADNRVSAFSPSGAAITVPEEKTAELEKSGGRVMSHEEEKATNKQIAQEKKATKPLDVSPGGIAETYAAGFHAHERGVLGAFGVPLDKAAVDIAELFGESAGNKTAAYLRRLEEDHPYASGWMEAMGSAHGAIGAAELAKAPTSIASGAPRTAAGFAARMGYGGMENVVQGTTRDINEDAIGRASPNGEKLWTNAPKHFLLGAGLAGVGEGIGMAAESGVAALTRRAEPALERGASAALGREVGETGEAAVTAGQRIRGASRVYEGAEVPGSRGALLGVLEAEQGALRKEAATAHAGRLSVLEGEHTAAAGRLSMEQEAARKATMARGAQGVEEARGGIAETITARKAETSAASEELRTRYQGLKQTLREEKFAAEDSLEKLVAERAKVDAELKAIVKKGEKKGLGALEPEYDIHEAANLAAGFTGKRPGAMTGMFDKYMAEQFERRAEGMLGGVGASTQSEIERLTGLSKSLRDAHKEAELHLAQVSKAEGAIDGEMAKHLERLSAAEAMDVARLGRQGERTIAGAEKGAERSLGKFEKGAEKETKALGKAQEKEVKKLGGPEEKTVLDPYIAGAKKSAEEAAQRPAFSSSAGIGAVMSLIHGNPFAAAGTLLSSLAAGRVRAGGNLLKAQAMVSLAEKLRAVDKAVQNGAASIFGRTASLGAEAGVRGIQARPEKKREPSFEEVSKSVLLAKGNPQLIERHVQAQLGPTVQAAPQAYGAALMTAQRAQQFLESMLPAKQRDPNSIRPDLQPGDVSDTEKYDFMQYVKALRDPLDVLKDVREGTVTEQQVEAIKFVTPDLYEQMRQEVLWQATETTKPLDYEREIHLGTLLGVTTDQVLEPDFQSTLKTAYEEKAEAGASANGSKGKPGESKVNKDMMSASQQAESGGMP
jgi:hypothetical protein